MGEEEEAEDNESTIEFAQGLSLDRASQDDENLEDVCEEQGNGTGESLVGKNDMEVEEKMRETESTSMEKAIEENQSAMENDKSDELAVVTETDEQNAAVDTMDAGETDSTPLTDKTKIQYNSQVENEAEFREDVEKTMEKK